MKFVILAVAMLALVACGLIRLEGETPHLDQIEGADERKAITRYVECVNSRFPDPSSGYRATTEDAVARELLAEPARHGRDGRHVQQSRVRDAPAH